MAEGAEEEEDPKVEFQDLHRRLLFAHTLKPCGATPYQDMQGTLLSSHKKGNIITTILQRTLESKGHTYMKL